jgi:hypothetical protein
MITIPCCEIQSSQWWNGTSELAVRVKLVNHILDFEKYFKMVQTFWFLMHHFTFTKIHVQKDAPLLVVGE